MVDKQNKAYILALIAVIFWSTIATAFKISLEVMSIYQLLLISSLVATIILFMIVLLRKKISALIHQSNKNIISSFFLGLINPFIYYLVLFEAYNLLPAQEALTLNYTWAIVVVIFSIIFLKQKIKLIEIVSLLISFLGVIIIVSKGEISNFRFSNIYGVILALSSAIIWAFYWVINMKDKRENLIKITTNFFFGSLFIIILFAMKDMNLPKLNVIFPAIYVGVFEMGLTFILWLSALQLSENTSKVSNLIFLSPFLSLILINLILKESVLISTMLGLALIMTGLIIRRFRVKK